MDEVWKQIIGWDGYEVSSRGDVRSTRVAWWGRVLRPFDRHGYKHVVLCVNRRRRSFPIHRLVLDAFVGPRPAGMECRHLNNVRDDNRVENLAWGTKAENTEDKFRHGSTMATAKLTEEQVAKIKIRLAAGDPHREIAGDFGVHHKTISQIARGLTWRRVTADTSAVRRERRGAKLNEERVSQIKTLLAQGFTRREIAGRFGVSHNTINRIAKGETWRDVEPAL